MPSKPGFVIDKVRVSRPQSTGLIPVPPQVLVNGVTAWYHLFTKSSSVKKGKTWGALPFVEC